MFDGIDPEQRNGLVCLLLATLIAVLANTLCTCDVCQKRPCRCDKSIKPQWWHAFLDINPPEISQ